MNPLLRLCLFIIAACLSLGVLRAQSTPEFEIRDETEFRQCVPVGAKLEKIAGDLAFTEGCQWIPRDGSQ